MEMALCHPVPALLIIKTLHSPFRLSLEQGGILTNVKPVWIFSALTAVSQSANCVGSECPTITPWKDVLSHIHGADARTERWKHFSYSLGASAGVSGWETTRWLGQRLKPHSHLKATSAFKDCVYKAVCVGFSKQLSRDGKAGVDNAWYATCSLGDDSFVLTLAGKSSSLRQTVEKHHLVLCCLLMDCWRVQ